MSTAIATQPSQANKLESTLILGDLSKLTVDERVAYYNKTCESLGLNPLTKPFEYIQLNGKLTLYAKRDATDQLRMVHGVSVKIISRENIEGVFVVTAQASLPSGRVDESIGAVQLNGLKGDVLANALMKCETKAKRRVTLSICGLGFLDETEAETIPHPKFTEQPIPDDPTFERAEKSNLGDYIVPIGKKYKGKKLSEIAPETLADFVIWLEDESHKKSEALKGQTLEFVETVYAYFKEMKYPRWEGE